MGPVHRGIKRLTLIFERRGRSVIGIGGGHFAMPDRSAKP